MTTEINDETNGTDETAKAEATGAKRGRKPSPLTPILDKVRAEVARQESLWGEQNHPLHGGQIPERGRISHAGQADTWKDINDRRVTNENLGWDGILLEEVFEALGESDLDKAVEELVQVAAVAVSAIASIERNRQ